MPVRTNPKTLAPSHTRIELRSKIKTLTGLFKLRIVLLLLISALGGAILGADGWPGMDAILLLIVTGGLSSAGASAVNQYLERERDIYMVRTRKRALPSGAIKRPIWVLICGMGMIFFALSLSLLFNPLLAISNALGALIYILIYTIWLKPRTILNIVIGGAAGSMAVISGGAAVNSWDKPGVLLLALLVFAWTPTHFWSLALAYRKDYARAGFPMLPVLVTPRQAAWWIAVHTFTTGLIAIAIALNPSLGLIYIIPVSLFTFQFIRLTLHLLHHQDGKTALSLI